MEIALLIVRSIILIGLIGFAGTFVFGVAKKWSMPIRIGHMAVSVIVWISWVVEIILAIKLKMPIENWQMQLIHVLIAILMALYVAINIALISQDVANRYDD